MPDPKARISVVEDSTNSVTLQDLEIARDLTTFVVNGLPHASKVQKRELATRLFRVPPWVSMALATKLGILHFREQKLKEHARQEKITRLCVEFVTSTGELIRTRDSYYWFYKPEKRVYRVPSEELNALLYETLELNPSETVWEYVIEAIQAETIQRGRRAEVASLSHFQEGKLYVSRFDGNVYRFDGDDIELVPNGMDNIFFLDNREWKPYFVPLPYEPLEIEDDEFKRCLVTPINFKVDVLDIQDQQWMWESWILGIFFKSVLPTRPLLLLLGDKGSGKTTAFRNVLRWMFGGNVDVKSLVKDKEDAFIAAVTYSPIVCCDNVDGKIRWLPDHLAALATGADITLRKLYQTNIEETYHPDVFVALNSRTPEFKRDDVVDRLLLMRLNPLTKFIPESDIGENVAISRNEIWECAFERFQRLIKVLNASEKPLSISYRMADFALFGHKAGIALESKIDFLNIMEKLEKGKAKFVLEDDPIFKALERWLTIPKNSGRELLTRELCHELSDIARETEVEWPYGEGTEVVKFGIRLKAIFPYLGKLCEARVREARSREKLHSFKVTIDESDEGLTG